MNDLELIGKNKEGFTWYKNNSLTDWLHYNPEKDLVPKYIIVCDIYKEDNYEGRVILDGKNGQIISELSKNIEAAACKLDLIKLKYHG